MRFREFFDNPILNRLLEYNGNQECWSEALSAKDILAEIGVSAAPEQSQKRETVFRRCDSYKETYLQKVKPYNAIRRKFADFMELKRWNPNQTFGKSDNFFSGGGPIGQIAAELRHAHITHDLSILYKLEGGTIWLYGFYTHNELGTSRPPQINNQKNIAIKIANKTEADCPTGVQRPQPRYK